MRTYSDIVKMAAQDYSIGLTAHYKPLTNLVSEHRYKSVIEIGTAYAGNAYYMLTHADVLDFICIDPYKYYVAMPGFTCQEEYDTLFQFARKRIREFSAVEILRLTSKEAFPLLDPADLIFLDGDHSYDTVLWECQNYSKLINPGGVLSGHDYNIFEGVNKAVDEFAGKIGKDVKQLDGNIWYMKF